LPGRGFWRMSFSPAITGQFRSAGGLGTPMPATVFGFACDTKVVRPILNVKAVDHHSHRPAAWPCRAA
jgi:hypothetical protein